MVEPAHPGSSSRSPRFEFSTWHECSHFLDLFQDLTGSILLLVDDVRIDNEASVVTVNLEDLLAQSHGGAYRG